MQKLKQIKFDGFLKLFKCSLVAVVATLLGTVIFAFVLKFANLSTIFISYINKFITLISIMIGVMCVKKHSENKLFIRSIVLALIYALLCFFIFSILNGKFTLDVTFVFDLLFAMISSAIFAIISNILNRKTV